MCVCVCVCVCVRVGCVSSSCSHNLNSTQQMTPEVKAQRRGQSGAVWVCCDHLFIAGNFHTGPVERNANKNVLLSFHHEKEPDKQIHGLIVTHTDSSRTQTSTLVISTIWHCKP